MRMIMLSITSDGYTPLDPSEPGSSFVGRTNFDAGRGTYELTISDGTCNLK